MIVDSRAIALFWSKVEKGDDCWLWTGSLFPDGYGMLQVRRRSLGVQRQYRAHRYSWLLNRGDDPGGLLVLHQCDVRRCVRPDHLFLGTVIDNTIDKVRKGRHMHGDKHYASRLSVRQVLEIRSSQTSIDVLASEYGVSRTTIYDIQKKRTWRHLS